MAQSSRVARSRKIAVENRHTGYRLNNGLVKKLAHRVLREIRVVGAVDITIVFLDDRKMRPLNREFKKRDATTDVLSFRLDENAPVPATPLGEIYISLDEARRNARAFGADIEEEAVRYVIHGILHLFGYEDGSSAERSRMSKKENGILKRLCTKEDLSKVLTRRSKA